MMSVGGGEFYFLTTGRKRKNFAYLVLNQLSSEQQMSSKLIILWDLIEILHLGQPSVEETGNLNGRQEVNGEFLGNISGDVIMEPRKGRGKVKKGVIRI